MKRFLYLLGSISVFVGSAGLAWQSGAILELLAILAIDPSSHGTSLANESLGRFHQSICVALFGMLFSMGMAACCLAVVVKGRDLSVNRAGRILHCMAGILMFPASIFWISGSGIALLTFLRLAQGTGSPTAETLATAIRTGTDLILVGFAVFSISAVLFVVASTVGVARRATVPMTRWRAVVNALLAIVACGLALILTVIYGLIPFFVAQLNTLVTISHIAPKPSEIGLILYSILVATFAAFAILPLFGLLQLLSGCLAPSSRSSSVSEAQIVADAESHAD